MLNALPQGREIECKTAEWTPQVDLRESPLSLTEVALPKSRERFNIFNIFNISRCFAFFFLYPAVEYSTSTICAEIDDMLVKKCAIKTPKNVEYVEYVEFFLRLCSCRVDPAGGLPRVTTLTH